MIPVELIRNYDLKINLELNSFLRLEHVMNRVPFQDLLYRVVNRMTYDT